ncbi:hypothetical protein EON65_39955 [archaeon]|nr:MAG: hypothetical protein EON65_39955 [archaeon]
MKYVLKGGKDSLRRFLDEQIFSLDIFQDAKKDGVEGGISDSILGVNGVSGRVLGREGIGWSTLHPKDLLLIVAILRYHDPCDTLQHNSNGRDGGLMVSLKALHHTFTMQELQGMLWARQYSLHYHEMFRHYDYMITELLKTARDHMPDKRIYQPRCLLGVSLMDSAVLS